MAILDKVKTALRISHDALDDELTDKIEEAKAEMIRAGVSETMANSDEDPNIRRAIITFVMRDESDDSKDREGYDESFKYQLDNLRKSGDYTDDE